MMRLNNNKLLIIAVVAIFAISLTMGIYFSVGKPSFKIAKVYSEEKCIKTIDLNGVTTPYEFEVNNQYGENVIRVENGKIGVIKSDCKNQICVNCGYISDGMTPIICAPHKLVIEIESSNKYDTVSR